MEILDSSPTERMDIIYDGPKSVLRDRTVSKNFSCLLQKSV